MNPSGPAQSERSLPELLQWACVDLIQKHRSGDPVAVETYLRDWPELNQTNERLDLIDAELCIRHELGQPLTMPQWRERFPEDAAAIESLLRLSLHDRPDESDASASPDWFIGQKQFASGPGWWLIRGIHRDTREAYALKVLALPATAESSTAASLIQAVMQTQNGDHPAWTPAVSVTVHNDHLGVLRRWVHGTAWASRHGDVLAVRLRHLATLAMMVQRAHDVGCQHGGLHAGNVWIDHHGHLIVHDAGSSRMGLPRWLATGGLISPDQRITADVDDLRTLIAATLMPYPDAIAGRLLQSIRCPTSTPSGIAAMLLDGIDGTDGVHGRQDVLGESDPEFHSAFGRRVMKVFAWNPFARPDERRP